MKKVININFQGRVIPIEETAYDVLKQYTESLRRYFANEEGRDEIINDIEGRIGELFSEVLKKGSTCVTDSDVEAIIASMGRPEQFDDDEAKVQSQLGSNANTAGSSQQSAGYTGSNAGSSSEQAYTNMGARGGRFYRDENNKVVAGVCAGIANYFGIDPLVVRILFVIFAFGFGFGFVTYLVLWVAVPSTASAVIGSVKKRLFRDPENKLIAGVCSGLSQYFGVNVWIPRVLFLIPFISIVFRWHHWGSLDFPNFLSFSFSPGTLLLYIILWLIFPEAQTTAEKLEMKGERVDLNSIKNTIQNDMSGFKDRAEKFGKEVGERAQHFGKEFGERGRQFGAEAGQMARRGGSGVGSVLALIIKIFVYFILGCVLFGVVVGLFAGGTALTGLLPNKDFLITSGWENIFAWGTLVLFIWVPVVGIITWIIRRVAKMRSNAKTIRFTFVSLWLIGLFCFIGLLTSLFSDFKYRSHTDEQAVSISNPRVSKLEVRGISPVTDDEHYWYRFDPFETIDGDTAFVKNTRIKLTASADSNFSVSIKRYANGATRAEAKNLATKLNFTLRQKDSVLYISNFVAFSRNEKFRNQLVEIIIAVPAGKRIEVKESAGGYGLEEHFNFGHDWYYYNDNNENDERRFFNFDRDHEYINKNGRLVRTDNGWDRNDDNNDDDDSRSNTVTPQTTAPADSTNNNGGGYRYKQPSPAPAAPKTAPAPKPATPNKKDSLPAKQAKAEVRLTLPIALIERFSI